MASTSEITIRYKAVKNNVEFLKSLIGDSTRLSAVIKGNAYGHGTEIMVKVFKSLGIDHFSVYSSPEAMDTFRAKSSRSSILIMGPIWNGDYDWVIKNEIEFYISNLESLQKTLKSAEKTGKKARIHIDIETGMYRTGLTLIDLKKAVKILQENPKLVEVIGFTTHFAGAESIANFSRVKKQISVFKKRTKYLESQGFTNNIKHIASSAATIIHPDTRLDMVRVGILLYGYWPSKETLLYYNSRRKDKSDPLKRAIRWISNVVEIKNIPEGEFIGYGLSFQAQYKMKVMIVPVGYCNGYSRSLSNNGHVIVNGQKSPIVGSVNMNMIICDITNIDNVKIGDEVVLIGIQDENEITFSSFAEMNNSLNYEILARLPENIERSLGKDM